MTRRLPRELWIGLGVSTLAVGAMAIDHLIGTESDGSESGLADPPAFLLSVALSLVLAAFLFGVVIPRTARGDPERAAKRAFVCSLVAIASIPLLFLGLLFPLAGAGIALGLLGRDGGTRRGLATAAVVISGLLLVVASAAFVGALLF